MDQNNDPFFSNNPSEQPGGAPKQEPEIEPGAQVYPPPPSASYNPPPPVQPVQPVAAPPANNTRRIWLIVLIMVLALCLCCILLGTLGWFFGDAVLCSIDPSFGTCPVP